MLRQYFYRGRDGSATPINIRVANDWNCRMNALAITAAVFVGEEGGALESFVGDNDFTATYLLAFVGDRPAGTVRVRFFADFARVERLAILKTFRQLSVLNALGRASMNLARKKGYQYICGVAREDVAVFWRRMGGRPITKQPYECEYGRLLAMIVPLNPNEQVTEPFRSQELGNMDFEMRLLKEFEGAGIS